MYLLLVILVLKLFNITLKNIFEMKPEEFDMKELEKLLKEEGLEEVDIIMSMADKLRREGREEGIKEGKLKIARNMIENNIDIQQIIRLTELDEEKIKILKEEIQH
ncbi:MAG: hypothetical protein ACOCRL_02395 [Bacillota bacterium]